MRINIPARIELICASCRATFIVPSHHLRGRAHVNCPICCEIMSIYDSLPSQQRRQIYHAIRDTIEKRVYDEQQLARPGYFEDVANLHPDSDESANVN